MKHLINLSLVAFCVVVCLANAACFAASANYGNAIMAVVCMAAAIFTAVQE